MTEVRAYASLSHYWDHLSPVVDALRTTGSVPLGGVHAPRGRPWGQPLPRDLSGALWLVASGVDVQRLGPNARCVYLEHGAGQSYPGDSRSAGSVSYAGGDGHDSVALFLCPHETVAARWRARYPQTPAVVVGAPRLDRWHAARVTSSPLTGGPAGPSASGPLSRVGRLDYPPEGHGGSSGPVPLPYPGGGPGCVVAVAFHWPNPLCPESQWALPHYRAALPALRDAITAAGGELIGHGHPRAWRQLHREWGRLGVRAVPDLDDVLDQADLFVADNTSAAVEAASIGIPIVWLSAPWYRRDVWHGARFWEWVDGMPHVEDPADLVPTVLAALNDPPGWKAARAQMVASAYSHCDGHAAERAAAAIMEVAR